MEEEAILVCTPAGSSSPWGDNVTGECFECGTAIKWRPHADSSMKKVCIPCAIAMIELDAREGVEIEAAMTPATRDELVEQGIDPAEKFPLISVKEPK